jgi:membrane-bound lytic murein transglycosylase MltF
VTFNATNYFVDLGEQGGITYEAGRLLEKELNRRFKKGNLQIDVIFIPVTRDRLLPALAAGYGDIAAANLTITEGRRETVDFTDPLTKSVAQVVVTGPGAPELARIEDLSGQKVYVRASSAFYETLQGLNASLAEQGLAPVDIQTVHEDLEAEDILELTNAGVYPITVADSFMVDLWKRVLPKLQPQPGLELATDTYLGWAIRKDSPRLKAFLNEFARENKEGTLVGNMLLNRYFKKAEWLKNPGNQRDAERFRAMVDLFRKYSDEYGFNYLMVTAQAYQESGLDNDVRSRSGAVGVMQMLPSTARDKNVGISDIQPLENNIHAGVKYMRFILDRYFADAEMDTLNRHLFAFASYNAGPSRIAGLRRKAEQMGLDPNQWRGNVEVVAAREIGRETVTYVANIFKYYTAYRLIEERSRQRDQAKTGS